MNEELNIADLQKAGNHVMLSMRLKTAGILSLIFGLVAVAIGITSGTGTFGLVSMAIGGVLVLVGALAFVLPSAKLFILTMVATLAVAGWNIAGYWLVHNTILAALGVVQLKSAVDRFNDYKRLSKIRSGEPSPAAVDFVYGAVRRAMRGAPAESERVIQMRVGGMTWRILLAHRVGVLVARGGAALIIRGRDDLDLLRLPSKRKSRLVQVTGNVIGSTAASMSEQHFDVYRNWRRSVGKRRS